MHEHASGGNLWEEYLSLLLDPAHFLVEVTFSLLDLIILGPLLYWSWRGLQGWVHQRVAHEHAVVDREHGVAAHEDHQCQDCT